MASSFVLKLDTTGPAGVAGKINGDDAATVLRDIALAVTTTDPDTTGYQVKIWGDVDPAHNADIQATEGASTWINLATPHTVRLAAGDGTKALTWRLRDDVWNESATATDSIALDTAAPTVSVTAGPTPNKISKVATKNSSDFTFSVNEDVVEWKVKIVANSGALHNTGTQIPTAGGSTNVSGAALAAATGKNVTIKGADLESAGAQGDNVVKVFAKDAVGNWSV